MGRDGPIKLIVLKAEDLKRGEFGEGRRDRTRETIGVEKEELKRRKRAKRRGNRT